MTWEKLLKSILGSLKCVQRQFIHIEIEHFSRGYDSLTP